MNAYRIATFLIRKLGRHHEVDHASREPIIHDVDEKTWAKIEPFFSFLVSSGGRGFEITVREVELAS